MTDQAFYAGESDPQQCEYDVAFFPGPGHAAQRIPPRFDLRNHSPTGFSWGYGGSGPAQLALAILAHATGDDKEALKYYHRFKFQVLAHLPNDWKISRERVLQWLETERNS